MENEQLNEPEYQILNENFPSHDLSFKIMLIGRVGVGKSCLSIRATKKKFEANVTFSIDVLNLNIRYNEKVINLKIFETPGQDRYRSLISNYYKETSLAILVYAINE